jgi:hypothetical protein
MSDSPDQVATTRHPGTSDGPDAIYRMTKEGFERKPALLAFAKESA